ncbi:MAG: hypothetical protein M3R00_03640, partial [Pseudomonadota bacterium]|nr:hypothetical protein [Pseudomonadota bacterium]
MKKIDASFLQDMTKTLAELKAIVSTKDAASENVPMLWLASSTTRGVAFAEDWPVLGAAINFSRHDIVEYLLQLGADPNAHSAIMRFPSLLLALDDKMFKLLFDHKVDYLSVLRWVAEIGLETSIKPYVLVAFKRLLTYLIMHNGLTPEISVLLLQHESKLLKFCDGATVDLIKQLTLKSMERFEAVIKALVSNIKLDEQDVTLLKEYHESNNKTNTAHTIIDALYQLHIGKQYKLAFDNLINIGLDDTYLQYAKILLA